MRRHRPCAGDASSSAPGKSVPYTERSANFQAVHQSLSAARDMSRSTTTSCQRKRSGSGRLLSTRLRLATNRVHFSSVDPLETGVHRAQSLSGGAKEVFRRYQQTDVRHRQGAGCGSSFARSTRARRLRSGKRFFERTPHGAGVRCTWGRACRRQSRL